MSEIRKNGAPFVGYEYKEITATGERASFYLDCYQSFGWSLDGRTQENAEKGKLVLKRERKIMNKAELTRLQRHFEACVDEIAVLERSRTSNATIWALVVALIGTAFMAGATFAVVHEPPLIILTILLAMVLQSALQAFGFETLAGILKFTITGASAFTSLTSSLPALLTVLLVAVVWTLAGSLAGSYCMDQKDFL